MGMNQQHQGGGSSSRSGDCYYYNGTKLAAFSRRPPTIIYLIRLTGLTPDSFLGSTYFTRHPSSQTVRNKIKGRRR
jgi:hypothetical protein